jgi:hAT family C-terminal dimerisation region
MGVQDKNKIWNEIKKLMKTVIEEQRVEANDNVNLDQRVVAPVGMRQPMADLFNGIGDDDDIVPDNASTDEHKISTEVDFYKNLKGLSVMLPGEVLSDPLQWWQVQEKILPVLSILARRVLCVPATSAPTERVFSVAGLTLSVVPLYYPRMHLTLYFFMIVG